MNNNLKFIDIFAGLGGFHIALDSLGFECVFASEKKKVLADLYEKNFGIKPDRDITKKAIEYIPDHDILCAGFPCQPFSKAGNQKGLDDKVNGHLFEIIVDILAFHKPKYFILENVRNLESHNKGKTWGYIQEQLIGKLNYPFVEKHIFSPHNFGVPQHRERLFIVGSTDVLTDFCWPETSNKKINLLEWITPSSEVKILESEKKYSLDLWQSFLDLLPENIDIPSYPIWSFEFGETYPFENINTIPDWKKNIIRKNRTFYDDNKKYIGDIAKKIKELKNRSYQKLEWQVGQGERKILDYIIQFRGSGIRIKRKDIFPSLVAITTQVPFIGWEGRYINKIEGSKLQSIEGIKLPENREVCFAALGNAVNAKIIKKIILSLMNKKDITNKSIPVLTGKAAERFERIISKKKKVDFSKEILECDKTLMKAKM